MKQAGGEFILSDCDGEVFSFVCDKVRRHVVVRDNGRVVAIFSHRKLIYDLEILLDWLDDRLREEGGRG